MTGFYLGSKAEAAGYRLAAFDVVGSTNVEAFNVAKTDTNGAMWFAALQQSAGRGRRGRVWETPHGNLAASLLIFTDADSEALASLGFVAGVALNQALKELVPEATIKSGIDGASSGEGRIALKWPNDVLADGAKLAGILLEAHNLPDGRRAVVIGFGVNVVAAPEGLPYPATCLSTLGAKVDARTIMAALAESWVDVYEIWADGRGVAKILGAWRRSAAGIGAPVVINTGSEVVRGVFETIDDAGRLIVRTADGRQLPIAAGDVHFGTVATVR